MKRISTRLTMQLMPLLSGFSHSQLSILIYHRVLPGRDPMRPDEPTVDEFDWQMRLLRENFSPLPLMEAVERLQNHTLPRRAVCVTFDDGYADNALYALPVLQKYRVPATVFVSTGFLNGGRMWNDSIIEALRIYRKEMLDLRELELGRYPLGSYAQRMEAAQSILKNIKHLDPDIRRGLVAEIENRVTDLPNDLMMTDAQVQLLSRSEIAIGAHTVHHPILASVPDEVAHREILGSKKSLEEILQDEVEVFAYPNGKPSQDYGQEHRDMVEELGFKAAVSTHWGVSSARSDRYQLPRFTPWDRGQLKFALRMMTNYRLGDPLGGSGH